MKFLSSLDASAIGMSAMLLLFAVVVLVAPNMLIFAFIAEIARGNTPSVALFGLSMLGFLIDVALVAVTWFTVKVSITK